MADYSRYKTETLIKMRNAAWEKYYDLTRKDNRGWGEGMRLSKLPQDKQWLNAKARYDDIEKELERRENTKIENNEIDINDDLEME